LVKRQIVENRRERALLRRLLDLAKSVHCSCHANDAKDSDSN
jgi:hypothetical protein